MKKLAKMFFRLIFRHFLIYRLPINVKAISLTFDDGPSQKITNHILDVLNSENVSASFFVLGKHALEQSHTVRRIHNEGHDVFIHGYEHESASRCSTSDYVKGVIKTNQLISDICGEPAKKYFRPPYGDITIRSFFNLVFRGYKFIMWSYDSQDSFVKNKTSLLTKIKQNPTVKRNIHLFHDDYQVTAEVLTDIIRHWKKQGFQFVKLSDVI